MKGPKAKKICRTLIIFSWTLAAAVLGGVPVLEGKTFVFPEISGWRMPEKPQLFSPTTLYEYINGAADLYLSYEFQDLNVAEYRNEREAAVTVEIYRHKSPTQAFGIYSQERLANANFLEIGTQGYREPMVLNFLAGPYYVKINGYNTGAEDEKIMLIFGRKVEEMLGEKNSLPEILSSFPAEGKKKNTEKFISKNFLGYSFFHSGFTADYERSGKKFKIFVIQGNGQEDCRSMMEKYLQQTDPQVKKASEGAYRLKDHYHGEVDLFWKGKFIWGILDLEDPALRSEYLKQFENIVKK